jgi:hypothetical protein
MPNYVLNRVTLIPPEVAPIHLRDATKVISVMDKWEKKVINFFNTISGETASVDFNKIIPQPDNIFTGPIGEEERLMCKREGRPNWYDWNIENWGTKWNALSINKKTKFQIEFETAWSHPEPIVIKIAEMFPDLIIEWMYADEDTGGNCGVYKIKNGKTVLNEPVDGSVQAYQISFELRPHHKDNYELVDGRYRYKED